MAMPVAWKANGPVRARATGPDLIPALGLAGFFKKNLYAGTVVAGLVRFVMHFLSGAIFFGEYAPAGVSPFIYSLGYQAEYLIPDIVICIVAAVLLKSTIDRLNPNKPAVKAA